MSEIDVFVGSGNVFEDLGFPNPYEYQAKAEVSIILVSLIKQNGWNQDEAAERMGLNQSDVSNIMRGRLKNYSLERLFRCLNALDHDIKITVSPKIHDHGQVLVTRNNTSTDPTCQRPTD